MVLRTRDKVWWQPQDNRNGMILRRWETTLPAHEEWIHCHKCPRIVGVVMYVHPSDTRYRCGSSRHQQHDATTNRPQEKSANACRLKKLHSILRSHGFYACQHLTGPTGNKNRIPVCRLMHYLRLYANTASMALNPNFGQKSYLCTANS